jgi:hypothetical protein
MIIWRGRGVLVAIIAFGCLLVIEVITRAWFHDDTYYQQHGWPKLAGFLVAALIVWWLSGSSGSEDTSTPAVQGTTEPVLRRQDQLFFISVRYWPLLLCVLGVVFYFVRD